MYRMKKILNECVHVGIERCYQEIEEALGSREQVCFEDRKAMPYIQAVIHEAQRVADVTPLGLFHTTTTDTHIQDYRIPKVLITIITVNCLDFVTHWLLPPQLFFICSDILHSLGYHQFGYS